LQVRETGLRPLNEGVASLKYAFQVENQLHSSDADIRFRWTSDLRLTP
jgi:hypothetical protein